MKILTLIILIILTSLGVISFCSQQEASDLFVIYQEGKQGFINRDGRIVIPAIFYDVEEFSDGRARITFSQQHELQSNYGYIGSASCF